MNEFQKYNEQNKENIKCIKINSIVRILLHKLHLRQILHI